MVTIYNPYNILTTADYSSQSEEEFMKILCQLVKNEEGASMAEYALLLGLITVAVAGVITVFGGRIAAVFTNATNTLQ